jgi:hypothetical protein
MIDDWSTSDLIFVGPWLDRSDVNSEESKFRGLELRTHFNPTEKMLYFRAYVYSLSDWPIAGGID